MAFKNYYDILGLSISATPADIKSAYRKLSMKFHPDKNDGDDFLAEMFKNINEAHEVLANPQQKMDYDNTLKSFDEETSHISSGSPINESAIEAIKSITEYFKCYDIANQKYIQKRDAEYSPKPKAFTFTSALFSVCFLLVLWAFVKPKNSNSTVLDSTLRTWTTKRKAFIYSKPNVESRKIGTINSGERLESKEETNYFIRIDFKDVDSTIKTGYIRKKELNTKE